MTIHNKLAEIQQKLVAQKGQRNEFGGYQYRSAEDIMQAIKPHLGDLVVTITDDLREVGARVYVEAIVTIQDGTDAITTHAFAREPDMRKGQDVAQTTGSSSSYARKYALSGLFLIDNNQDPDQTSKHDETHEPELDEALKAEFLALVAQGDAYLYFLFMQGQDAETQSAMFNEFPHGQKTQRKGECREMEKEGAAQARDMLDVFKGFISAQDDLGTVEMWDELIQPEKDYVWKGIAKVDGARKFVTAACDAARE